MSYRFVSTVGVKSTVFYEPPTADEFGFDKRVTADTNETLLDRN